MTSFSQSAAYRIHVAPSLCRRKLPHSPIPARIIMAPLRVRHPKGVSTIQIDLESATVQDLLQEIYKITEILPSQQNGTSATFGSSEPTLTCSLVKAGYPPKSLTLVPELPVSSLGLSKGEQLVVDQNSREQNTRPTPNRSATSTSSPGAAPKSSARPPAPAQPTANGSDSIETEGGYLVHRVRSRTGFRRRVTEKTG